MKTFFLIFIFVSLMSACTDPITRGFEHAYFEGQKDALTGDIRIKRNADSCWIWIKSPWDSGTMPVFNPSYNCK